MIPSQQPASPDTRVRPRALWYLVVVVLWVGSAVVFGTAVASFVRVLDHGVTAIQVPPVVPVTDSGITIYSRSKPATNDCVLRSSSGRTTGMDGLSFDLSASIDHKTVYAVATSPDGLPAGSYQVTCRDVGGQLYYGDKLPLESILVRTGISVVLGLVGLAVLIVLLVRRHTSKSRIRTQTLLGAQGPGAGWSPGWAGGQPTGPYGQPAPPQPYQPPPGYQTPQPYQPPPGYPQQYPPYEGQPAAPPQPTQPPSGYDAPPAPPPPYDEGGDGPR